MALLNQKAFERKLQNMSSTQDSVQTVSLWMIHHKKHADDMVTVWLDQLKKASKADRRLTLFYLANDVLQNSRKKGKEFSNAFTKILRDAMPLLSEKTIKGNVERVIKIWEERKLFEKDYLEALRGKLALTDVPVISKKPKEKAVEKEKEVKPAKQKRLPPADFKPSKLIDALKALRDFEGELTLKESQLNSLRIDASDLESVRQLKDRTGGGKFCEEYESATAKLEEFSETLRHEQQERKNIVKVLEDGEAFYDVSYGEVKVIVHAYKTFGNRLTSLKKKVDSKVNRLAQKEAEKAKTGPVSAPQASFLTSGLPEVAEGSAPSTPTQGQEGSNKSSEDDKATDPTVDNIEVADMDIEDDSDSEKSETSEEASVQDPKSSNDETPNSTTSSDSQPTQATTKEPESTPVISPVPSVAPARPLTPNLGTAMPLQGNILPNQPQIVPPRPLVRMVTHPFMGVQGVRFPANAPQFRPGAPPIQPLPRMAQNQLIQPTGTLPGPGQITSQVQPFPQMPRPAGLLPSVNAPLPGGVGTLPRFPLGSGFAPGQAPLPVAVATVPAPVQVITNSVPASEMAKDIASHEVGSPDSEASAPSPVGSPELHLAEGDETPETTPAPLGDVDVNDNTGFQTNKSFFENPVAQSVAKPFIPTPVSQSPSSSGSTPSTSEQLGGQDAALMKKDNGQKVSAVDILAQLLSRGRKLQQPNDTDANSTPITPPVAAPVDASATPPQNTVQPQKPLLSLIDSLFPKLSDSIKTLKEKEKAVNSPTQQCNPPVVDVPTSLPARPLPRESQFQHPSSVDREQPVFQQSGLKSILKKGPKTNEDSLATGRNAQEFGPDTGAFERNSINHTDLTDVQPQGPVEGYPSSTLPEDRPLGRPVEMQQDSRDDVGPGPRHNHDLHQLEQQGGKINVNDVTPAAALTSHLPRPGTQFQGPAIGAGSPRFPQERPFERPLDMSPRGLPPFGPRLPFQEATRPQFQQSRDPPAERREGPPDMPGKVPPEQSPHAHSPRGSFRDGPPRRPSDTVHQEHHYMKEAVPGNPPDKPLDDRLTPNPRNNEDSFVNGPPGVKRLLPDGPPVHRPDPRQSPREQVPRGDGPPPHRASYPGTVDDMHQRREFERWEDYRREPYMDHRRGSWDFPHDHPGPLPPDWRGPPVSPRGDPKRVDFREDDPSMWTSFESPGRPSRTFEGYREGPPEFDRFHGYGPPGRRRHSEGDFESERMRFPLKRPGPPPVPFPGPIKRPYY